MTTEIEIVSLPKEKWKGVPIPLTTRSDSYYDFKIDPLDKDGCTIKLETGFFPSIASIALSSCRKKMEMLVA